MFFLYFVFCVNEYGSKKDIKSKRFGKKEEIEGFFLSGKDRRESEIER